MKRTLKKLVLSLAVLLCVWSLAVPVFADVIIPPSDGIDFTIEATQTEAATEAAAEVAASIFLLQYQEYPTPLHNHKRP